MSWHGHKAKQILRQGRRLPYHGHSPPLPSPLALPLSAAQAFALAARLPSALHLSLQN
eukprot:CAMPEP_0196719940 /NCGR_PEP_ID=MMETSP1091-20130531/2843_1 /TAXON_ID=302021 /ORGANISM="Rhodomonas sp., Strain CCMP768" /LENGTH=57 /DNA_ID=CAMNT_0042061033 /DNA_START=126 /DNA_END=299 /DNA_ORIENTATION=-